MKSTLFAAVALSLGAMTVFAAPPEPKTDWKETPVENEEAKFEAATKFILEMMKKHAAGGTIRRGFHAKPLAGLAATFRVLPGLPEYARAGVFAKERSYPAWVRFSNASGAMQSDRKTDARGLAVKVFGVDGERLLEGEAGAKTQDFLATNRELAGVVRNIDQYMAFTKAAENPLTAPIKLAQSLGVKESARILYEVATRLAKGVKSVATEAYQSPGAVRVGAYAMRFYWEPKDADADAAAGADGADRLAHELAARLKKKPVKFTLVGQFWTDAQRTPIEDTSVEWTTANSAHVKLAELVIEPRDLTSTAAGATKAYVDGLSFSPWHGIQEHRPLGNLMRVRKSIYKSSSGLRGHTAENTVTAPAK